MNNDVKCCTILQSMIIKEIGNDSAMITKKIVSIKPNGEVTLPQVADPHAVPYETAEVHWQATNKVEDKRDQEMLTKALADEIWKTLQNGEFDDFNEGGKADLGYTTQEKHM